MTRVGSQRHSKKKVPYLVLNVTLLKDLIKFLGLTHSILMKPDIEKLH